MEEIVSSLRILVEESQTLFHSIPDKVWAYKPYENKWSKKEILGHLIDSAHVNYDGIVRVQVEIMPLIIYNQDQWVNIQQYQLHPPKELITTWVVLNRRLIRLIELIPYENLTRKALDSNKEQLTLQFLITDYVRHLKHHLDRIFLYSEK